MHSSSIRNLFQLTAGWLLLMVLAAAAARASDAPASQPTVPLGDGRFHFTPPASDQWDPIEQENPGVIVYRTKKKDALVAVQLLPGEMEINPDVTAALIKQLQEAHQQKKEKLVLEPTVEKDDDLALKVHERYIVHGKTADRVHMYRQVGKRMALAVVNSKGQSDDDTKAAHAAARDSLLSVTGPLRNGKRAATNPAINPKRKPD